MIFDALLREKGFQSVGLLHGDFYCERKVIGLGLGRLVLFDRPDELRLWRLDRRRIRREAVRIVFRLLECLCYPLGVGQTTISPSFTSRSVS